jgi:hypothetical protein
MCRAIGTRIVWAISNFVVFLCMATTSVLSLLSMKYTSSTGIQHVIRENKAIRNAALVVFSLLGLPLSVSPNTSKKMICHLLFTVLIHLIVSILIRKMIKVHILTFSLL